MSDTNNNQEPEVTMESFLQAFGITQDKPPADEPPKDDPPKDDPPKDEPPADDPPKDEPPKDTPPEENKTAQAFAQLRVTNKKYENVLKDIAGVLGVQDTSNPENLLQAISEKITHAQAKQQNVPPEVLTRLKTLEEKDQTNTLNQIRTAAYLGFQKVKDTFNLQQVDLEKFADDLIKAGTNPFEQVVDLVQAYKIHNFDKLLADAEAKGAAKEAERANKANQHGSTPGTKQGQGDTGAEKITTINGLNEWFAKQTGK